MRVLVARSPEDAAHTAGRLRALGHEGVIAPATEIVPSGEPCPPGPVDALVVTSAHAAAALEALPDRAIPVYAVGPHTAEAVRRAGFRQVIAAEGDALSLAALVRAAVPEGACLLHVAGRHRKEEPAGSLRAAGFGVRTWVAYEASEAGSLPEPAQKAIRTGQIGAVLHYSRRSASILLRLAEEAGLTSTMRTLPHLCLSADVAEPLRHLGMPVRVAAAPHEDALLALLDGLPRHAP